MYPELAPQPPRAQDEAAIRACPQLHAGAARAEGNRAETETFTRQSEIRAKNNSGRLGLRRAARCPGAWQDGGDRGTCPGRDLRIKRVGGRGQVQRRSQAFRAASGGGTGVTALRIAEVAAGEFDTQTTSAREARDAGWGRRRGMVGRRPRPCVWPLGRRSGARVFVGDAVGVAGQGIAGVRFFAYAIAAQRSPRWGLFSWKLEP